MPTPVSYRFGGKAISGRWFRGSSAFRLLCERLQSSLKAGLQHQAGDGMTTYYGDRQHYRWRQMTEAERTATVAHRREYRLPKHSPPPALRQRVRAVPRDCRLL